MAKEKFCVLAPGDHGSTYGGNALTCAAAFAVVEHVIHENILNNVKNIGQHIRSGLSQIQARHEFITEIRGMGLLIAIAFNSDVSGQIVSLCNENGLLLNPVRPNAIRLMPPLNVTVQEVDLALERLEMALSKVTLG